MNSDTLKVVAIGFVLVASVVLGSLVGQQNLEVLSFWVVCGIAILYFVTGWKSTWVLALFFILAGVTVQQGFAFGGSHLTFVMVASATAISFLNRDSRATPTLFRQSGLGQLKVWLGLLLIFGMAHFGYSHFFPYDPDEYSPGNAAKAYYSTFASFILVLWLAAGRYEFRMGASWLRTFWLVVGSAVVANTIILGLMVAGGLGGNVSLTDDPTLHERLSYYIPVINLSLNRFTMRTLGAESFFLVSLFFLNRNLWRSLTPFTKFLVFTVAVFGLAGAVLSGGRVAVLLAILLAGIALIKNRRIGVIMGGLLAGTLFVLLVNIFSSLINEKASPTISRSLQLVMIEKGEAYGSIQGSNNAREMAAQAGWDEWRSDDRVFLTGRSVYRYLGPQVYETLKATIGNDETFSYFAVRSATVHNLFGEIAIQYGLFGMTFYTFAMLSVIVYCIKVYRRCRYNNYPPEICELAFYCAVATPVFFAQQIIGGGYLSPLIAVLIGIVRSQVGKEDRARDRRQELLNKDEVNLEGSRIPTLGS